MNEHNHTHRAADDLCVITSYFNPNRYATKQANFVAFRQGIEHAQLQLFVIECAFGNARFELPPSAETIQVRSPHILWQKERLLNMAIERLPPRCTKVAWIDCDILFERDDWAVNASRQLDIHPVVQLFERTIRLPRGQCKYQGEGEQWESFAAIHQRDRQKIANSYFSRHGHTGFAWAARRDLLARHGLYDACLSGSGDHVMAHGMCGDTDSPCVRRVLGRNEKQIAHFRRWSQAVSREIQAKIACTPGTILHLWHGEHTDRKYDLRNQDLARFDFDPDKDLRIGKSGCWEWSSTKADLHRWAISYFHERHEDGTAASI